MLVNQVLLDQLDHPGREGRMESQVIEEYLAYAVTKYEHMFCKLDKFAKVYCFIREYLVRLVELDNLEKLETL